MSQLCDLEEEASADNVFIVNDGVQATMTCIQDEEGNIFLHPVSLEDDHIVEVSESSADSYEVSQVQIVVQEPSSDLASSEKGELYSNNSPEEFTVVPMYTEASVNLAESSLTQSSSEAQDGADFACEPDFHNQSDCAAIVNFEDQSGESDNESDLSNIYGRFGHSQFPYDSTSGPELNPKFTYKKFYSIKDVKTLIRKVQESFGVKFIALKKGHHFGVEENWDPSHIDHFSKKDFQSCRILWSFSDPEKSDRLLSCPCIPYDGTPFVGVSSLIMACEHVCHRKVPLTSIKVKEYRQKVEAGEITHVDSRSTEKRVPRKRRIQTEDEDISVAAKMLEMMQGGQHSGDQSELLPSPAKFGAQGKESSSIKEILPPGVSRFRESKKTSCQAVLSIKQVAKFPGFRVPPTQRLSSYCQRQRTKEIRDAMSHQPFCVPYQMVYYCRIPNSVAHVGHELKLQPPTYISTDYRERVLNFLVKLKERDILSDIKFNVQGQKRQLKLHSSVLASAGVQIRDLLVSQNYEALAQILMPLNKASLDAFFKFAYTGYLEVGPEVEVDALEVAFRAAGIKEGVHHCQEHTNNPKMVKVDDWNIKNCAKPKEILPQRQMCENPSRDIVWNIISSMFEDKADVMTMIDDYIEQGFSHENVVKRVVLDCLGNKGIEMDYFARPLEESRSSVEVAELRPSVVNGPQNVNCAEETVNPVKKVLSKLGPAGNFKVYVMSPDEVCKMRGLKTLKQTPSVTCPPSSTSEQSSST